MTHSRGKRQTHTSGSHLIFLLIQCIKQPPDLNMGKHFGFFVVHSGHLKLDMRDGVHQFFPHRIAKNTFDKSQRMNHRLWTESTQKLTTDSINIERADFLRAQQPKTSADMVDILIAIPTDTGFMGMCFGIQFPQINQCAVTLRSTPI